MSEPTPSIAIWNREKNQLEGEKIFGERWIRLAYGSPLGKWFTDRFLVHREVSRLYGSLQNSPFSRGKIAPFIRDYQIDMSEFEPSEYRCFNDFFIRAFAAGRRPFNPDPNIFCAPAEGRYLVYPGITADTMLAVKGENLDPVTLLGDAGIAQYFLGGSVVIARLCPTDYHRFHFPSAGNVLSEKRIAGLLHSVNPIALESEEEVFIKNERHVTLIDTPDFGRIGYVEIGALCVGKIVQSYGGPGSKIGRGQEKGYFLFGGSTVVFFTEPGRVQWDLDLVRHTTEGLETLVKLGTRVGVRG